MIRMGHAGLALAIGSALWLSGCGSSGAPASIEDRKEQARATALVEVGEMLRLRKTDASRPAAKVKDLAKYEPGFPVGFRQVSTGEVVVMLGAPVEEGSSESVIAYEKQVPESGGYVLMQDGTTVRKMTPDEFRAAPKAPGTPTAGRAAGKRA